VTDEKFLARLAASMKRHERILQRLAQGDDKPCSNKKCRLVYAHSGPCDCRPAPIQEKP
jgi:hypothetical protein